MPTDIPKVSLFLDYDKPGGPDPLLEKLTSGAAYTRPSFVAGDVCKLALYFRTPAAVADDDSAAVTLPTGATFVVSGKPLSALGADQTELFTASTFVAATGLEDEPCYEGVLDLTGAELASKIDALAAGTRTLAILVEIEVWDAIGYYHSSYQFQLDLYRQVYRGGSVPGGVTSVSILSPSGYLWALTIDDDGNMAQTRQADPDPLVAGATSFNLHSPSGYTWKFEIADDGTLTKTRIS